MQAMTLLRRMMAGDVAVVAGLLDDHGNNAQGVQFAEPCADAVKFDIQVAADLYWRGDKDGYQRDELGPLKLPYSDMWLEWEVPDGACVEKDEAMMSELVGMRCGAYLKAADDDRGFVLVYLAVNPENDDLFVWPTVTQYHTDRQGKFIEARALPKFEGVSEELARQSAAMVDMFALPALMALGLINCKNVKHRETGSLKMRRSGTEKRRGIPARELRYNTIILPGEGSVASSKHGGSHRAAAIHRVRGHFKTFTAEKPLLGKHVGTYWWGWSVRGNPEHGEVQSDYVIGERA